MSSQKMGEKNEAKIRIGMDLLKRFTASDEQESEYFTGNEESGELELNLGLSLGGRFGIDKTANKLARSSSVIGTVPFLRGGDEGVGRMASYWNLMRTSSLPMETESEWRKRKELQTLRRMAAKRRRSEKQRSSKGGVCEIEELKGLDLRSKQQIMAIRLRSLVALRSKQVSVESQGGGSMGMAELERGSKGGAGCSGEKRASKEVGRNALEDMPSVFTKGDGPNGRRVDGILYKYGKGEEVRIMCVCHGSFLSPAEFIKHAGGGDVAHPLKHIVINRS